MCGILGVILADTEADAVGDLLEGCHYLQHRGQDAAGIMTCGARGRLYQCKGNGMVRDVFTNSRVRGLLGPMGVGHLRYPTAGTSSNSEAQPFYVNSPYGLVLSHNGNLTNASTLRTYMDEVVHRHINTDSDSELLLNVFASKLQETNKARTNVEDLIIALKGVYELVQGAYACTAMVAGYGIIGFRDANGIRPLVYGHRDGPSGRDYMFASENIVLEGLGFKDIRDVVPGQAIIITKRLDEPVVAQIVSPMSYTPCIFEYVYFARPDSVMDGISVYRARIAMGKSLAQNIIAKMGSVAAVRAEFDAVVPVPDTSNSAALAAATVLGVPYCEGFVKNRYVGRTFIMPSQTERKSSVRRKLSANPYEFKGRSVLIVDDSIVRGTTSKEIIQMAREAGARCVSIASCAPPIRFNHIYGIDLADNKELVAFDRTEDQIAEVLGCDHLFYQEIDVLIDACLSVAMDNRIQGFEIGVFNGSYVTAVSSEMLDSLQKLRRNDGVEVIAKSENDINIHNQLEA